MTPREMKIESEGSIELYKDKDHRWVVTRDMLAKRPEVRVLVILEDARSAKGEVAQERVEQAAGVLQQVDVWRSFDVCLMFLRTAAKLHPELAQRVMEETVQQVLAAPLSEQKKRTPKEGLWYPLSRMRKDYRAAELARIAVLGRTYGLDPSPFTADIAALLHSAENPAQHNVGSTIVGLHYAGFDTRDLLKWAVSVVEGVEEFDHKQRPWRVVVAQAFAAIALFTENRPLYEKFLSMTTDANARTVRKIDDLTGEKRDKSLKDMLYLNWSHFKQETAARPKKYIPLGDDIYDR